MNNRI